MLACGSCAVGGWFVRSNGGRVVDVGGWIAWLLVFLLEAFHDWLVYNLK